jgi:hypothetical protein
LGKGKPAIGTHTRPDLDVVASVWMFKEYGDEKMKKAALWFLKGGDEELNQITGIVLIDRGRGKFDHHGRTNTTGETSASLVAKKLGIVDEKSIQQLLALVQRSDLQGISEPFDASDLIKCLQRNNRISDEEIIEIGVRIIQDTIEFRKNALPRDNQWLREIIFDFLKEKMLVPPKFQRYLELLANPKFERPFDLVEIAVVEKMRSEKEAEDFVKKLLEIEYKDSAEYLEALGIVKNAWKKKVNSLIICAAITDNSKFNPAARAKGAAVIVQRNSDGHNQIYFDSQKVNEQIVNSIISMVRLEECLVRKRKIPKRDLRKPGRIEEIPEWYYYVAPIIIGKKKKPGRFILNGSLTAPDVPPSKISWETLLYIVECAILYQPLNWARWKAERLAYYLNKK